MSHEVRTPLNAIIGFSEVLLDGLNGGLNEKQKEYLSYIAESGKSLQNLVLNVLDFSEAESDRMELRPARFAVKNLIATALSMVREQALRQNVKLITALNPDADIELEADAGKCRQILFYLLNNAVKFTPAGGSVRVSARKIEGGKVGGWENEKTLSTSGLIEISVADTGIGIKPEDMPRLFEEFTQLEAPITKKYQGTGLGLALTKKLVELHGGNIRAESVYGKGSSFVFVLPLAQPAVAGQ
jgi:signal transduction histidine kinase